MSRHLREDKRAAEWFRKAADLGDAKDQFYLGALYDLGLLKGLEQDRAQAAAWYHKAAEQGLPQGETVERLHHSGSFWPSFTRVHRF